MEVIYITDTDFINKYYKEEDSHSIIYGMLYYQDKDDYYFNVLSLLRRQKANLIAKTKLKFWIEELNIIIQALKAWKEKADNIIVIIPFVSYEENIEVTIEYFKYSHGLLVEFQNSNWNDSSFDTSEIVTPVPSLESMLFELAEHLEAGDYCDENGCLYINGKPFTPYKELVEIPFKQELLSQLAKNSDKVDYCSEDGKLYVDGKEIDISELSEFEALKIPKDWEGYSSIAVDEMIRRGIKGEYRKSSKYNEDLYRNFFISEKPISLRKKNNENKEDLLLVKNTIKIGVLYYMLKDNITDNRLLTKIISFACDMKYDDAQKISSNTAYSYIQKRYFLNKQDGIDRIKEILKAYNIPISSEFD